MTTCNKEEIDDSAENWESGALGTDANFVEVANDIDESSIDSAFELQSISIRLENSLIDDFKAFSRFYGVGYQPLIRQALHRFAEGEKRMIANHHRNALKKLESKQSEEDDHCEECA